MFFLRKKPSDPHVFKRKISVIKDLNQLAQLSPNPYKSLGLSDFFSKDIFDKRYIPALEKKKYTKYNKK